MPKQNQANEVQQDKKNRAKVQPPALSPDLTAEKAGLPPLPESLLAAGANSIEAQAARLGDSRLQTAQRQGVAGQIGRTQGNLHLQRVVAALKPDQRTTSASPSNSKSSGSPVLKKSASPTAARQAEATESPVDDRFDEFLGGSGSPSLAPPPPPPDKNGQKMAVQRDGTSLPPVPNFTLTTPSLLQPPDPASRYRLGGDQTLHLDPEIQAMLHQHVQQQLAPANLRDALSQIQLGSLPLAAPGAATTPAQTPTGATGSTPAVPAGSGSDTPRAATPGDLMGAVLAVPEIDAAINHLQSQALDQVNRDWRSLGTGGQVAVVSSLAVIGLGALGGAMSDPTTRQLLVDQLNGRTVPVPGLNWMRLEVNTSADNLMLGMHVDVGQLLPSSWGFKSSSPSAIGGPPTPQPFVPGQRTAASETGEPGPSEDIGARIQAKAGGGQPLDEAVQRRLEDGLEADLSGVRVHTDHEADELAQSVNAVAFTTGQDIFFREGTYHPDSTDGLKLLAHEATHTVQQTAGPVAGTPTAGGVSVSDPGDRFEQAAEQAANSIIQREVDPAEPVETVPTDPVVTTEPVVQRFLPLVPILIGAGVVGGIVEAVRRESRSLNETEINYAKDVFHESLDYSVITITRGSLMSTGAPRTIGNTIHFTDDYYVGDTMELTDAGRSTLVHEMAHVWQYQHDGWTYAPAALWAQAKAWWKTGSRNAAYDWRSLHNAGTPWADWNPEAQAEAVQDYNEALRKGMEGSATPEDYETLSILQPYIADMQAGPPPSSEDFEADETNPNEGGGGAGGGPSNNPPAQRQAEATVEAAVQRQIDGAAVSGQQSAVVSTVQRAIFIQRQPASMAPIADKITSDDPEHLRQILEEVAIGHGMDNAEKFVDDFSSSPRGAAANDPQLAERIKAGLRTQLAELKTKAEKMIADFERLGLNAISEMLNESEKILQAEAEKYGLHEIPREITGDTGLERAHQMEQGGTGQYTVEDNEKTRGMAAAAAELAPKRKELDDLITKQQELIEETPILAGHGGKIITDQKKFDELGVEIRDKEVVYNSLRAKLEAEYPLLAAYASEKGGAAALEQIANTPGGSGPMIAETIRTKLKNIDEVRQGIADDKVKVWKLPVIVNGVKGQLGYTPGTLGHKLVEEKMAAQASKDALINLAVAAVSIALGLVAAIPTGGASVGVSVAVGAAAAGGAVISGVQAVKAMQDYQLAQAMNGSAVDKAKAISQEDPSLFWLALDIVGAVLDVYGALKTFKQVAPAVREALAARRAVSEIGEEGSEEAVRAAAQAKQKADELKKSLEGVPEPAKSNIVNQVEGPQKGWLLNPDKPMSSGGFAGSLANKPGCGVFEGHIPQVPDKTVVIKIYPADDEELMKVFAREKEGAAAAAQTKMGPKYYGEVDMGPGKRAFAMEKVAGDMPEDMSEGVSKQAAKEASKAAQSIKLKTLDDVRAYANQIWEKGYYCHGDLQGLIDEAGNWRPIDFQGVYKRPPVEDVAATADALKQHNWQVSQYNKYLIGQMPEGPYKDLLPPINPPPRAVQPYREPDAITDMKQVDGSRLAQRIEAAGSGHPLDARVQPRLEASLGTDLTAVRVHTDQEADELAQSVNAVAFTTGQDIFFREGTYKPDSTEGLKLLAHEATHTVQQAAGPVEGTPTAGGVSVSDPHDRFEQAAEQAADAVVMRRGDEEASSGLAYEFNPDSTVGGPKGRLGTRPSAVSTNMVIARQPAPPTPGPAAKGKAPDAAGMVTAQYPKLNLPSDKMAILQKVFDARFELEKLADKMKPYEGSILSDDVRKREAIQAEMAPHQDFLYKNQALVIPTENLLAGDMLGEDKPSNYTKESAFRESLYKTLITHATLLVIGPGLEPKPLFTYKWGPNHWLLNNEGGQVTFKNVLQIEKFNIAYQAVLAGEIADIVAHMEKVVRQMGGKILSITGKKIGETYGHVWNTTVKVGNELGPITGYANDPEGRVELDMDFFKMKGARMVVAGPDNWMHIFSLNPNINCYDMKEPDDDGYVYLLDKGNQVSGIQRIITNDGRELERGVTESGSGWRTKKELSDLEQFSIGAILGDAFEDPSATMTFGQIVMGVIPVVGQIADARDVAVGIYKMWSTGGKDGKLQTAMALIGFIPLVGDGVKSAWKAAKGAGKEATQRAVREAIQKAAPAAQETLAKKLLQNADEVLQAFPNLSKEEVKALTKSLSELGEKALKEGGEAAKQYAEEMAKHLDQLGGNAGALVQISGGKWAKTAKALAATPEGAALGKRMQDWRVAQFDALDQKMAQKATDMGPDLEDLAPPKMERTGTPSFTSDVDVSFLGSSSTSHRNAAIRMMEQSYGPGWRDLLDADIFADPTRLHMFEEPLKEIGGKAAKEVEKRIVKESELNVLAKMMKDGADPEAVKAMAKEMGVSMADVAARQKEITKLSTDYLAGMMKRGADPAEVQKLAAEMGVSMEDVARHMASGEDIYRQMELKMDVLHKRFLAAEGDPAAQAAIAEEMATIQGKLNAAIPGPYMTPGGGAKHVTRREPKLRPGGAYQALSPALGYTALLDDLYMLQHAVADVATKGFTEKSAKAMAKYADRILMTAGQFGVDMGGKSTRSLFDSMSDLLALGRKDPAALAKATSDLDAAKKTLDGQITTILDAVKKNADDYLAETPGLDAGAIMKIVADSKRTLLRMAALIGRITIRSEQESQPSAPANQD